MQGHASAIGSLSETLNIDHGSTPNGTGLDQQVCWNNVRNSAPDRVSEYILPGNRDTNHRSPIISDGQTTGAWSMGEPNSSVVMNQTSHNDQKAELSWASTMRVCARAGPSLENRQHESAIGLSLNNNVNLNSNQIANGPLFMQSSSSNSISQDLNIHAGSEGQGVDDCQIVERPLVIRSGLENLRAPTHSRSSNPFELRSDEYMEDNGGMPNPSLEGRRLSRKRKATEDNVGQSSRNGSSNYFQHAERSAWRAIPAPRNTGSSSITSAPSENTLGINQSEQVSSRLILGVGGVPSEISPALSTARSTENSHRNLCSRINSSQQGSLTSNAFTTGSAVGSSSISAPRQSSRLLPHNSSLSPAVTDANTQVQFRVHVPSMRQNLQSSRRNRNSSTIAGGTSTSIVEGDATSPGESSLRRISGNTMEHPIFVASSGERNSGQSSHNWTLSGGNVGLAGTAASSSQGASAAGSHRTSGLNRFPHRNPQQYPRRLSELVRRSLLSASGPDSGAQNINLSLPGSSTSDSTTDVPLPSEVQWPHLSQSRSAISLDRHVDGASRIPYSLRTLATASEGRSRLVSEIRDVLDLMRRGEGLRFEDIMLLDHSVLFGMGDFHDRHRDMRVDVDNMSYEELLALEERIGNVNTGLSEETISSRLKQTKYTVSATDLQDQEPCCVCQEEYKNGDDLGELECGHNFHAECIKQWLTIKNLCPICKTTGMGNGEKP